MIVPKLVFGSMCSGMREKASKNVSGYEESLGAILQAANISKPGCKRFVAKGVCDVGNHRNESNYAFASEASAVLILHLLLEYPLENNLSQTFLHPELKTILQNQQNKKHNKDSFDLSSIKKEIPNDNNNNQKQEINQVSSIENVSINSLYLGIKDEIISELNRDIHGSDWTKFAATMQEMLHEPWISELYSEIENSSNPSKELFKCWSTKDSFTIGNLKRILEIMGHQKLLRKINSQKLFRVNKNGGLVSYSGTKDLDPV